VRSEVFIDASAWFAVVWSSDQYHAAAAAEYRRLVSSSIPLITTNLVVAEAHALIRRDGGHARAMRFLESLRTTPRVARIYSDADLEERAERLLAQYADQAFSFADAVSFVVMQERGIAEAFSFDHHFLIAGFSTIPYRE
jgi:predicted nucleic acid-binding protein